MTSGWHQASKKSSTPVLWTIFFVLHAADTRAEADSLFSDFATRTVKPSPTRPSDWELVPRQRAIVVPVVDPAPSSPCPKPCFAPSLGSCAIWMHAVTVGLASQLHTRVVYHGLVRPPCQGDFFPNRNRLQQTHGEIVVATVQFLLGSNRGALGRTFLEPTEPAAAVVGC